MIYIVFAVLNIIAYVSSLDHHSWGAATINGFLALFYVYLIWSLAKTGLLGKDGKKDDK